MADLLAYCDPQSAAPGDTIHFMVSCVDADRYRADIVRLLSPEGPPTLTQASLGSPIAPPCTILWNQL